MTEAYAAPRTTTERALAEIWEETLGIERVGIHDNFFDLGGDSIRSIQVHAKARQRGLNFAIHQLFRHSTINEIAQEVTSEIPDSDYLDHVKTAAFSLISEGDRARLRADIEDAYPLAMLQRACFFTVIQSRLRGLSQHYQHALEGSLRREENYGPPSAARFTSPSPAHLVRHDELHVSPSNSFISRCSVPLRVDESPPSVALRAGGRGFEVWFETERGEPSIGLAPTRALSRASRSEQTFQLPGRSITHP